MKKLISLVLCLLLMSLFSIGCGKTSQPEQPSPSSSTQTTPNDPSSEKPPEPSEEPPAADHLGAKLSGTYAEMMKNGQYFMKYTMTTEYEGQSMEVEATVAVSGDKSAMTSIMEGIKNTIIFKDGKTYMVNHAEKMVLEMPEGNIPDDETDYEIETDGLTFINSGVEDGLTYEEYSTTDSVLRYYFDGKKLVKIAFEIEGQTMVMNILEMSDKVSDSMFELPSGYETTALPG